VICSLVTCISVVRAGANTASVVTGATASVIGSVAKVLSPATGASGAGASFAGAPGAGASDSGASGARSAGAVAAATVLQTNQI